MKKILLIILFCICSVLNAQTTIVDSYSESNYNLGMYIYNGFYTHNGQSFTGNGGYLTSCKFYLKKYGAPPGTMRAELYAHSGTYGSTSIGTGGVLDVSTDIAAGDLTTSYQLFTFTFDGDYLLENGVYYVIVLKYADVGGDWDKCVYMGADNSAPTHSGNRVYYSPWGYSATVDVCFYVYSTEPSGGGAGQVIIVGD